jgi:hypothetical protein
MAISVSIFFAFWHDKLVAHHKQALFLVLVGFLAAFCFIRLSVRLMRSPRVPWWPGSVVSGGVHLHHLVFGIGLMVAAGTVGFATFNNSPSLEICAAVFGIGAGLTIDEFALWVHLDDVYWSEEGRASIDAAVIATLVMGLIFLEVRPFAVSGSTPVDVALTVEAPVVLSLAVVCFAKQRFFHGATGLFIWPLALYGATRIGKPGSLWAHRRYGERDPAKQAKSQARFRPERRTERLKEAFRDAVGGTPTAVYEAKLIERGKRTAPAGTSHPNVEPKPRGDDPHVG